MHCTQITTRWNLMFGRKKKLDADQLFETCMQKKDKITITATHISTYYVSPFSLYCNHFVNPSHKDPTPDQYLAQLANSGVKHEQDIADEQFPDSIFVKFTTPEDGFRNVVDEMVKGVKAFLGSPLFYLPDGMYGIVDQLVQVKGKKSIFGKYHYIIKEVKIARNIKKSHILQTAFYNYIIGKIQGYTPNTFYILNMDKKEISFEFADYKDELFQTINKIKDILGGEIVPTPTFGSCSYPWSDYCDKMALESKDISLISGIGLEKKKKLVEFGINNLDDILHVDRSQLLKIPGIGGKTADNYLMSAMSLTKNKIIRKSKQKDLPNKKTEIFLDLEGFDTLTTQEVGGIQTDYLIGIWIRNGNNEEYIPFVAHDYDKEKEMLIEFIDFIKKQNEYVIYHWHHYEKIHLTKMMDKHGISQEDKNLILNEVILIDLYPITTKQFVFPIPNTSLKAIAKYLGFSWTHQDIGAMNSIKLYRNYVDDANEDSLKLVLDYNKDDCKATRIIKDWLVKQEGRENLVSQSHFT